MSTDSFSNPPKTDMNNKKLFASLNNKKGIFFEKEGDNTFSISVWKKETPVAIIINEQEALEISNFISSNLKEDGVSEEENEKKITYWANYIEEFKEKSTEAKEKPKTKTSRK